jgi:hypothetical protein
MDQVSHFSVAILLEGRVQVSTKSMTPHVHIANALPMKTTRRLPSVPFQETSLQEDSQPMGP